MILMIIELILKFDESKEPRSVRAVQQLDASTEDRILALLPAGKIEEVVGCAMSPMLAEIMRRVERFEREGF